MIQHKCNSCGHVSTVEFFYCTNCNGNEFSEIETSEGSVIMSLQLNATAAPFPDNYYVNLVEKNGTKIFCRSDRQLEKGESVKIDFGESGIVCY